MDAVTKEGQLWISDTIVNRSSVLRMMVTSYLTGERHLKALEDALGNTAMALATESESGQQNPAVY